MISNRRKIRLTLKSGSSFHEVESRGVRFGYRERDTERQRERFVVLSPHRKRGEGERDEGEIQKNFYQKQKGKRSYRTSTWWISPSCSLPRPHQVKSATPYSYKYPYFIFSFSFFLLDSSNVCASYHHPMLPTKIYGTIWFFFGYFFVISWYLMLIMEVE